ncbi:hypothetical protein [Hymenobacter mucosus]|nr:hypothetical protein [Hymenobacter mucosus]
MRLLTLLAGLGLAASLLPACTRSTPTTSGAAPGLSPPALSAIREE